MAGRLLRCTLPAASWGIKRQRTEGRRPSHPPSVFVSRDEEDCILGLLMLSGALLDLRRGVPPPPQAPKQLLMLPSRSSPPPAETREQESPYLISFPGLMPLLPPPKEKQSPALKQQQQQRQNETLSPATPSTADLRRYECPECGKAFFSYQALGGHKSSHRKRRWAQEQESPYLISFPGLMPLLLPPPEEKQSSLSSPALKQEQQRQNETLSPATPSTADLRRYECPECGKAFSSYQALGGHKSIHRKRRSPSASKTEKQRRVKARRAMLCHRFH
ncbi:zinc finger protein ZAT5-like [Zingiber officinale]|uniref:zinc finger protein ZAT5-like n=1 Tax=Zingiber officinale TaxID=94328 RepID=UPI001C4AEA57|nr:zinc finger protein ZAT5-like [Zingiber officinale]